MGDLDFSEYVFRAGQLEEIQAENFKNRMEAAAFTAWLGSSSNKSFTQYLQALGLQDKTEQISGEMRKKLAARAVSIAERIKSADKKRKSKE